VLDALDNVPFPLFWVSREVACFPLESDTLDLPGTYCRNKWNPLGPIPAGFTSVMAFDGRVLKFSCASMKRQPPIELSPIRDSLTNTVHAVMFPPGIWSYTVFFLSVQGRGSCAFLTACSPSPWDAGSLRTPRNVVVRLAILKTTLELGSATVVIFFSHRGESVPFPSFFPLPFSGRNDDTCLVSPVDTRDP